MIESEAYSELCQTFKVECFTKIGNSFKQITIFKKLHLRDFGRYLISAEFKKCGST